MRWEWLPNGRTDLMAGPTESVRCGVQNSQRMQSDVSLPSERMPPQRSFQILLSHGTHDQASPLATNAVPLACGTGLGGT
jgi:hypothetical protein